MYIPPRQTRPYTLPTTTCSCSTTFVQRSGEKDDTLWYRIPPFFITIQGVSPLLLSRNLLRRWKCEILEHPLYSPDMSSCDYDIFVKVKEPLRETRYITRDELSVVGRSIRNINKMDAPMVYDAFQHLAKDDK